MEQKLFYAAEECGLMQYDFVQEILDDIEDHIADYENPDGFFEDLQYGGCASGMIGKFIYNSDCLEFYSKYGRDMESFIMDLQDEYGEIPRNKTIPYYTWACWICYEEVAYRIHNYILETA